MLTGLESPTHLILLLLIILLLFGGKRLPEMGRSLGRGIREFKEGLNTKEDPEKAPPEEKQPEAVEDKEEKTIAGTREKPREKKEATSTKGSE